MYGGIDSDFTCRASPTCKATRRDYVIANAAGLGLISNFEVDHNSNIPVHDIIKVHFKGSPPLMKYNAVKMPATIHSVFMGKCRTNYWDLILKKPTKRPNS